MGNVWRDSVMSEMNWKDAGKENEEKGKVRCGVVVKIFFDTIVEVI